MLVAHYILKFGSTSIWKMPGSVLEIYFQFCVLWSSQWSDIKCWQRGGEGAVRQDTGLKCVVALQLLTRLLKSRAQFEV